MNKQELINHIKDQNEWSGNHRFILIKKEELISMIEDLDQPQKVKVPACVAKWISKCQELNWNLSDLLAPEIFDSPFALNTKEWLRQDKQNYDILARAWLDGYEVKKEPLYRVIMPNPQSKNGNVLVLRRTQQGTITVNKVKKITARLGEGMDLTEEEIKSVDERYWPFAVPVEEVAEG